MQPRSKFDLFAFPSCLVVGCESKTSAWCLQALGSVGSTSEKRQLYLSSRFWPTHTRPPWRGLGLLQERWRTWKPMPQLVLQGDQEVQGVQAPFLQTGRGFQDTANGAVRPGRGQMKRKLKKLLRSKLCLSERLNVLFFKTI